MKKKCLVIVCFLFVLLLVNQIKETYSLFETNGSGMVDSKIAGWNINVNGTVITKLDSEASFELGEIIWDSENHVVDGKAAPGSVGSFDILIDPTGTDVSFIYEITLDFSDVNNENFEILSISEASGNSLIRTGEYSYAGFVPLDLITDNKTFNIKIEIVWINNEDNNKYDYQLGKNAKGAVIPVTFKVSQYVLGDEILEYVPESSDNNETF